MTVFDFARSFLNPYTIKDDEIIPMFCPICKGGNHQDKKTFALNLQNKTFNCKRGSCGEQGHFTELCAMFGVEADMEDNYQLPKVLKKSYKKPKIKPEPANDAAMEYMKKRGITAKTIADYKIGVDAKNNIIFPFFDEENQHVFNKFRHARKLGKGDKRAWREAGTMPILFGMHLCDYNKPLTITEGEFDAMVCHDVGIPNAVSVPSGADDFTWVDTCWEFLMRFNNIYLFGDNDDAGKEMVRKLTAKLSDKKIHVVEHQCKDANELLFKHGKDAVLSAWVDARQVSVSGLIRLADVTPLDIKSMPRVKTSISKLNHTLGGFYYGNVTLLTGKRGEGKSTLMSQLLLDALEQGDKVCAYSGELRADQFQYWSDMQAAGRVNVSEYYDSVADKTKYYVQKDKQKQIHEWYDDNYWLYDNSISLDNEETSVLKIFDIAAKRYDCRVFAIDNLMTVDYTRIIGSDFYQKQSKFVQQVVNFAKLHNAHVFLVAHPRKTDKNITNDDISGSADITNRVDNVIVLSRQYDDALMFDATLSIIKNRWEGILDDIGLNFDSITRRLYSPSDSNDFKYSWEQGVKQNKVDIKKDLPW